MLMPIPGKVNSAMNAYRSRPNTLPWPPILLVLMLVCGVALNNFLPLALVFPGGRILGIVLIATALSIDLWAMTTLRRAHTTIMPHRGSSHLVTEGPFKLSRNPIYLAYMVLLVGIGLFFQNCWLLPLAVLDGVLLHYLAIRGEESHLIAMFGYKYENYMKTVRRWI